MRALFLACCLLPLLPHAQPGYELFREPCGGPASYGVVLQDVRRFDLEVVSGSMGTDDEPSSSGNCTRGIVNRAHASFLHLSDGRGGLMVFHPDSGYVLQPESLKKGLATGRLMWGNGHLPVCYMGYGAQSDGKGWRLMDEREWKRSIVRVETPEATYLVEVMVDCLLPDGLVQVHGTRVVLEGEPLPMQ